MKKPKSKAIHFSGTRKRAVARVTLSAGKGKVMVNGAMLQNFGNNLARMKIREPLVIAADYIPKVDIRINVSGGGIISQAEAARLAVAKCLNQLSSNKLRPQFLEYDRTLLVADVRQRESRKPNCCGRARAKRQKSYR